MLVGGFSVPTRRHSLESTFFYVEKVGNPFVLSGFSLGNVRYLAGVSKKEVRHFLIHVPVLHAWKMLREAHWMLILYSQTRSMRWT